MHGAAFVTADATQKFRVADAKPNWRWEGDESASDFAASGHAAAGQMLSKSPAAMDVGSKGFPRRVMFRSNVTDKSL